MKTASFRSHLVDQQKDKKQVHVN